MLSLASAVANKRAQERIILESRARRNKNVANREKRLSLHDLYWPNAVTTSNVSQNEEHTISKILLARNFFS